MDLTFYKLHSTGGDFVLSSFVQGQDPDLSVFPELSRMICKRRTGVGANGLIVLTKGIEHPIKIHYFPALVGESHDIPGDALVCVGRYAFNLGLADNARISAESESGAITIEVIDSMNFRVDLGIPKHPETGEEIHPTSDTDIVETARTVGRQMPFSPIMLRKKYAVVTTERRPEAIRQLAQALSESKEFAGYQAAFMRSISQEECSGYCWTTDSTPDHAESMAACAAVGILNGFCDNEVTVRFRSYMLHAEWQRSENRLYITAPSEYICSGSYSVEDDVLERLRSAAG